MSAGASPDLWMAVDAMSGDNGPTPLVSGTVSAVRELDAHVLLVGDEKILNAELKRHGYSGDNIRVVHASDVITMDDSPAMAVRQKKDASVNVAARLVASGEALGFFSPGNTGASMAASLAHMGRLPGVKRPAIATPPYRAKTAARPCCSILAPMSTASPNTSCNLRSWAKFTRAKSWE
jgi:glycerol-3-phosphate acyltransferase PlsX